MRTFVISLAVGIAVLGAALLAWRRDPRIGSGMVNAVINPWLLGHGYAGGEHSELGPLEHIGRRSGIRRLTPVHPEPTPEGFRVMVPLGDRSEWARNVLAAGRCRLQLHGQVYELEDPKLVRPGRVEGLPRLPVTILSALGFRYLTLRTARAEAGCL